MKNFTQKQFKNNSKTILIFSLLLGLIFGCKKDVTNSSSYRSINTSNYTKSIIQTLYFTEKNINSIKIEEVQNFLTNAFIKNGVQDALTTQRQAVVDIENIQQNSVEFVSKNSSIYSSYKFSDENKYLDFLENLSIDINQTTNLSKLESELLNKRIELQIELVSQLKKFYIDINTKTTARSASVVEGPVMPDDLTDHASWWKRWGKCAAGTIGGALTGGLGGCVGGATVGGTVGTVGGVAGAAIGAVGGCQIGAIVGAVGGALTGASLSCDGEVEKKPEPKTLTPMEPNEDVSEDN